MFLSIPIAPCHRQVTTGDLESVIAPDAYATAMTGRESLSLAFCRVKSQARLP